MRRVTMGLALACGLLALGHPSEGLACRGIGASGYVTDVSATVYMIVTYGEAACGGSATFSGRISEQPKHGTVTYVDTVFRYAPEKGYRGEDRFTLSGIRQGYPFSLIVNVTIE
ncbi:MAG: hypothetical protein U1E56_06195 [Bauldia sp.]